MHGIIATANEVFPVLKLFFLNTSGSTENWQGSLKKKVGNKRKKEKEDQEMKDN